MRLMSVVAVGIATIFLPAAAKAFTFSGATFNFANGTSVTTAALTGLSVGPPQSTTAKLSTVVDKSTPILMKAAVNGDHFKLVEVDTSGGGSDVPSAYCFIDALISGMNFSGQGNQLPTVDISLSFVSQGRSFDASRRCQAFPPPPVTVRERGTSKGRLVLQVDCLTDACAGKVVIKPSCTKPICRHKLTGSFDLQGGDSKLLQLRLPSALVKVLRKHPFGFSGSVEVGGQTYPLQFGAPGPAGPPPAPPQLPTESSTTLGCPAAGTVGSPFTVHGTVTPALQGGVLVVYTSPGGDSSTQTAQTAADGSYSDSFTPNATGKWTVVAYWKGDADHTPAVSEPCTVNVSAPAPPRKESSSLSVSCASVVGDGVSVTGSLTPPLGGEGITLTYTLLSGGSVTKSVATDAAGGFSDNGPAGAGHVEAVWGGDDTYDGSSAGASC